MCVASIRSFWLDVRYPQQATVGNNYNHSKILDWVLDLNYFSFPNPKLKPNPTHLPKHQTLTPNHQFSQRILFVEYHSVHVCMAWSQKFRLTAGRWTHGFTHSLENDECDWPTRMSGFASDVIKEAFVFVIITRLLSIRLLRSLVALSGVYAAVYFLLNLLFRHFLSWKIIDAKKHQTKRQDTLNKTSMSVLKPAVNTQIANDQVSRGSTALPLGFVSRQKE